MANLNVFEGFYNIPTLGPAALTSETVVTYPVAQGVGVGSPAFPAAGSAVLAVTPDQNTAWDGKPFRVRVRGKATGGASAGALTVNMYWIGSTVINPATVPASGNKLATLATSSLTSASGNFMLDTTLVWDSVSQGLQGYFAKAGTGITASAATALSNVVAPATQSALTFVPTVTFAGGTANSVTIVEFSLEAL